MKISHSSQKRNIVIVSIIMGIALLFSVAAYFGLIDRARVALTMSIVSQPFPEVDTSVLDARQQKILALLRQEYAAQPPGTKYSEGVKEPWCADFVSWIMREADAPLSNPNSGSWRIPGVLTLQEYYQSIGAFQPAASGYQPKLGDVVLYGADGSFGQHTNIVIKNEGGVLTTVGGNENGRIGAYTNDDQRAARIIGYGVLKDE